MFLLVKTLIQCLWRFIDLVRCYAKQDNWFYIKKSIVRMTDSPKLNMQAYLFSLIRLRGECKIIPTVVDFSPPFWPHSQILPTLPIFNKDDHYFTPAFILATDKKTQSNFIQFEKKRFQHRIRQNSISSETQIIEDVAPLSTYCQICQEHFKDYNLHLSQKNHLLRWYNNEFNDDIQALCKINSKPSPISPILSKTKHILKKRLSAVNCIQSSPKKVSNSNQKEQIELSYHQISFLEIES